MGADDGDDALLRRRIRAAGPSTFESDMRRASQATPV
jgi:hypothetical protein